MVWKLYKQYIHPLARVVRGLPISWAPNFATVRHPSKPTAMVAWSSCSRFIAVNLRKSTEVLDAVTLERLHTFVHPYSAGYGWSSFSPDGRSLTSIDGGDYRSTTWDLQAGGRICAIIPDRVPLSFTYPIRFLSAYSMDGKVLAVAEFPNFYEFGDAIAISTYNLISGTPIYSHNVSEGKTVAQIWTHGEFLRFATVESGSITIWEAGFTSEHTLAEIESLPAPDNVDLIGGTGRRNHLFLPTLSRLAFILGKAVLIWDARDSKFLLNFMSGSWPQEFSFSSDGRFFACGTTGQGAHLWKESPTGYVLHRKFASDLDFGPSLSPDGESIITSEGFETQLWRRTDPINPPSSFPTQPAEQTDFVFAFSPDKSLIATGRLGGNVATIVDLKSGDPRLIVDTGMRICGLGVTGSTAIAVGEGKIITWNLPAGDLFPDARANIHDSIRTIVFNHPPPPPKWLYSTSISPDFNHLLITKRGGWGLDIYHMSTGQHLVDIMSGNVSRPWFTRDGHELWYSRPRSTGKKIIRGGGSDDIELEPLESFKIPSGGYLWESSHGHNVTNDGWILDSREKRVMWLPHHLLRVSESYRIWDGRFLVLFDPGLPEPVIIELYE